MLYNDNLIDYIRQLETGPKAFADQWQRISVNFKEKRTVAQYTREQLIEICEKGFVPQKAWYNRDSAAAQIQLYKAYGLLKAGCDFVVVGGHGDCCTDEKTIWLYIFWNGFSYFDHRGPAEEDQFYLPTFKRLEERKGLDWY